MQRQIQEQIRCAGIQIQIQIQCAQVQQQRDPIGKQQLGRHTRIVPSNYLSVQVENANENAHQNIAYLKAS